MNHQKQIFKTINIDTFEVRLILALNYKNIDTVYKKITQDKLVKKKDAEYFKQVHEDGGFRAVTISKDNIIIILFPFEKKMKQHEFISIMAHEINHVVYDILYSHDIHLSDPTCEIFAYLTQHITREFLKCL